MGDRIELVVRGALTATDVEAWRGVVAQHGVRYLLADLNQMTGMDAKARLAVSEWSGVEAETLWAVAAYGCSFSVRAVITLLLGAIRLIGRNAAPVVFVRDADEGRAWIDQQRSARAAQ